MSNPTEHRVEVVIALVAPKAWNPNSAKMVHDIVASKMNGAVEAANRMAHEWTKNGEPVRVEFEMRMVTK